MRGFKILLCSAALLAGLAFVPEVRAQIVVEIGVPPVCQWGYYEDPPYGCAPELSGRLTSTVASSWA